MPRRRPRPPPPPPLDDRDLAADVLNLHSLWHRGPPAPAAAPAPTAKQSRSARHNANRRKRRRMERAAAAQAEDAGSDRPLEPSPPASPSPASPAEPTPSSPGSPAVEYTINNGDGVRVASYRRKANRRKRRRKERYAAESQGAGSPWPRAPSPSASSEARPSASPRAWPDAAPVPAKPPPQPRSPGSLAQREALRAAAEFFAQYGSDDEGSESEGEEEEEAAAAFFTGMFERDAALRGHYERGWEEGTFACLACAGRKARRGNGRRFLRCVGLVQHARDASRNWRRGAHRALTAVVCRVLGWDIEGLPNIVIDPRGTLGQALASRAQSDAHEAKMDVETKKKDSSTGVDGAVNELVTKESAEMEGVGEIGPLNCKDSSKNNVVGHETIQEEDAVKTRMDEPISTDGEKESSDKDNANKDDSLSQDNNGVVHEQNVAREITEKENEKHCIKASVKRFTWSISPLLPPHPLDQPSPNELNATVSEPEHAKTADDIGDTVVTRTKK